MLNFTRHHPRQRNSRTGLAAMLIAALLIPGAIFAQPPLSGGDCVIVCPPNPNIQCACIPTGPVTPPSPDVGSDPAFTVPGHLVMPALDPFNPLPISSGVAPPPSVHTAFTMIGDSRTHLTPNHKWEPLLGPFKSPGCSTGISRIDNYGVSGTTTDQWLTCLRFRAHDYCRSENMNRRVVLMLGGNDVLNEAGSWSHIPWGAWRTRVKNSKLNTIHGRFKSIVNMLRSAGRDVLVQNHFGSRPAAFDPYWNAVDDAMQGLRSRLYYEYTPGVHITKQARVECTQYYKPCYIVKRDRSFGCRVFRWCNHVKFCYRTNICTKYEFRPPEFAFFPGVPGVELANLPGTFPASHFHDRVHLNVPGLMSHAYHLSKKLNDLCWW